MDESVGVHRGISPFLADTWWFGLTDRLSDEEFLNLVKLRQEQGFTAIQIVVGIPPEVGPKNPNAMSQVGAAWDLKGRINYKYLHFAQKRIKTINNHGMMAIIYGAWGHQIDWIGVKHMCLWWKSILEYLDNMNVLYCLTGESDIWCNPFMSKALLPDKTTDQLEFKNSLMKNISRKVYTVLMGNDINIKYKEKRLNRWSYVLEYVSKKTKHPIIIHTTPDITGLLAVNKSYLLSANTFQTGHSRNAEKKIWELPYNSNLIHPYIPCINLEPWYEGICDDFFREQQLRAFWLSVCSGVKAICYGAHGIWNVGDGDFLNRWGKQRYTDALKFDTPTLLGKSFALIESAGVFDWSSSEIDMENGCLKSIARVSKDNKKIIFIPEIRNYNKTINGKILDVYSCQFSSNISVKGQVVIFEI